MIDDDKAEREFKKIRSIPNLYRRTVSGKYYLLVKRNGRQFRRSLKTNDFALAKRRLHAFGAKASRLTGTDADKGLLFEELSEDRQQQENPLSSQYLSFLIRRGIGALHDFSAHRNTS